MKNEQNQLEKTLPFDQYSRQKIVSHLIETGIKTASKKKHLNIIDLGGHKGETTRFQPADHVTILDVFDETYENYVKGDATQTDFEDNIFDIACSFDVFEHIPREHRQAFIDEALRISRYGLFIAMPIDTEKKVSAAERLLNDFHKTIFSSDHRWLKEHIDYKIPTETETTRLIEKSGAYSTAIYSNQIGDWQLMQMLIFAAARNPLMTADVNNINQWYNKHTLELDAGVDVGYRGIFFVSKDRSMVDSIDTAINNLRTRPIESGRYITINEETFRQFSKTFAKANKDYTELLEKYNTTQRTKNDLLVENSSLKQVLTDAQAYNKQLTKELDDIYDSASWKITKPMRAAKHAIKRKK